jgi:putative DNA primase/helicase
MSENIIRSSQKNPCPVCDRTKDGDCSWYPDGRTVMCKTYVDGMGHDESQWHYNGVNELGFQGKFVLKAEPDFVKPPRPKSRKDYYYPARDDSPLAKVTRTDDGKGKKVFYQSHWDGGKWVKGNPDEIKQAIPIYRYVEVRSAIDRNELIFVVEGESTADALWKLGIAATTTIGGSGGYANYGSYQDDLKGARLVLCPDRDLLGIKYMSNFERDFECQIEGWYLAGTAGLWQNPQGGMDIGDDLNDYDYTKEQIFDSIVSPSQYQQIFTNEFIQAQLLDIDLLLADSNKPRFTTSWEDGLNWETIESTAKGDLKRVCKFIGNHIEAVAYVKNPEGAGTGILLEFRTQRHELQRIVIPRTALVGDGLEALRAIVDQGYYYNLDCRKSLLGYLFGLGGDVERLYTIADKTGWVNGSFLTLAKTYGDPDLRFRDPEPDNSMTEIEGTLDGWKSAVAAKCGGNSRLIFSLGTAFAAPLLAPTQIESGGFHLVGITSIGKTTALNVAASVAGLKTIPNWRSTANALEGKATEFNHMLLPLDEIYQADPQTVGASAYMLGNGQGKARMNKSLTNTKPKTWEILFLSTGEVSMTDYLRQAKTPAKGGMETRMPSIRADAGKGYGVFEYLHGYQTSDEFVAQLETAIRKHQGTAQDAYLAKLVAARRIEGFDKELRERVHAIATEFSQQFKDTAISRVAIRFALVQVGLELAHSFGLLPFPIQQCGWSVRKMFDDWLDVRGGEGSIEIKEACNRIEHLFVSNQHGDRICDLSNPDRVVRNLLAYKIGDTVTSEIEYCVPTAIFDKELADGVDRIELGRELQKRGWLKPSTDKRGLTLQRRIAGTKTRFFVFYPFWEGEQNERSGINEKTVGTVGTVGTELTTVDTTDLELSQPVSTEDLGCRDSRDTNELPSRLHFENNDIDLNTEIDTVPTVPTGNNDVGTELGQLDINPSQGLDGLSRLSRPSRHENRVSENSAKNDRKLKIGDRVRYTGNNANLLRQYTGIISIFEISGDKYTCLKPDGKLTSWIELDDLQLAEVAA